MDSIWDDFFNWGVPEGQNFSDHLWLKQLNDKFYLWLLQKYIFQTPEKSEPVLADKEVRNIRISLLNSTTFKLWFASMSTWTYFDNIKHLMMILSKKKMKKG